jgi:glycosyltransferase involved in cell wall biosynthesis
LASVAEKKDAVLLGRSLPIAGAKRIAVVIPCYRASETICGVVRGVSAIADAIYVVDDCCPEGSGDRVEAAGFGPSVTVIRNPRNLGVGGAMKRGYSAAVAGGVDIVVKLDADGQMDPAFIPRLVAPLVAGTADYAKGNRFGRRHLMPASGAGAGRMPTVRRIGNNLLSFLHKGVTGQWQVMDPTNGFTAIHRRAIEAIDLAALSDCYFFETDMLFQLGLAGATVEDVPLPARYSGEVSSLRVRNVLLRFPGLALRRFGKRVATRYFLDDFNMASVEIILGLPLMLFGTLLGLYHWLRAIESGVATSAGTVMFAALPIIIGFQLLLSAIGYDIADRPRTPLQRSRPEE